MASATNSDRPIFGRVDLAKRLQDGVLKKIPGAHGLYIPSVLKNPIPSS